VRGPAAAGPARFPYNVVFKKQLSLVLSVIIRKKKSGKVYMIFYKNEMNGCIPIVKSAIIFFKDCLS